MPIQTVPSIGPLLQAKFPMVQEKNPGSKAPKAGLDANRNGELDPGEELKASDSDSMGKPLEDNGSYYYWVLSNPKAISKPMWLQIEAAAMQNLNKGVANPGAGDSALSLLRYIGTKFEDRRADVIAYLCSFAFRAPQITAKPEGTADARDADRLVEKALSMLADFQDPQIVPFLKTTLERTDNEAVRIGALMAVSRMKMMGHSIPSTLIDDVDAVAKGHFGYQTQHFALDTLVKIDINRAVLAIQPLLDSDNSSGDNQEAVFQLSRAIDNPKVVEVLKGVMMDPKRELILREQAAGILNRANQISPAEYRLITEMYNRLKTQ